MSLHPTGDLVALFRQVVDVESVSGGERELPTWSSRAAFQPSSPGDSRW